MSDKCGNCGDHSLECKIKPCPFCGSIDIYYVSSYPWGAFSCNSCNADGPPIRRSDDEINFSDELRMIDARKVWNIRVNNGMD